MATIEERIKEAHALGRAFLNQHGHEVPDPTPMEPAIGFKREPTLHEKMREMIRGELLARQAIAAGQETFEEADDFDTGEDDVARSPFEVEQEFEGDLVPAPAVPAAPAPASEPAKPSDLRNPVNPAAPAKAKGAVAAAPPGGDPEGD